MSFDKDVTAIDFLACRHVSPDTIVIEQLSISFYMGFISFDISYRDFFDQRIQRTCWLTEHFRKFIPRRFWKRIINADVNVSFLTALLPSDYTTVEKLTIQQLVTFLRRFAYWERGEFSDIDAFFQRRPKLKQRQR